MPGWRCHYAFFLSNVRVNNFIPSTSICNIKSLHVCMYVYVCVSVCYDQQYYWKHWLMAFAPSLFTLFHSFSRDSHIHKHKHTHTHAGWHMCCELTLKATRIERLQCIQWIGIGILKMLLFFHPQNSIKLKWGWFRQFSILIALFFHCSI